MTVDVEDWFHILDIKATPDITDWNGLPSRVEMNTHKLLDLFMARGTRATWFCLGWVAERFPQLIARLTAANQEIASHGYGHQLVTRLTPAEFRADIRRSKQALEDASGREVTGYRAPGFSITPANLWAFDILIEEGYRFDSSVFPSSHGHGGIRHAPLHPFDLTCANGQIAEFPMTQLSAAGQTHCFSGGGYLRLLPLPMITRMAHAVQRQGRPVVYYIHPRDIDADQPRIPMPLTRRFKCYVNLRSTERKLTKIVDGATFIPMGEWFQQQAVPKVAQTTLARP